MTGRLEAPTASRGHRGADRERRVRVLGPEDVEPAATLLARAFGDEPAKAALLPDEHNRFLFIRQTTRIRLRATVPFAAAYAVEIDGAMAGVALWQPPNVKPNAFEVAGAMTRALFADVLNVFAMAAPLTRALWRDRQALWRVARGRNEAARVARRGQSWYLALLGTDERFRGRGVARQLLDHVLDRCDADGLPTWTETTDAGNVTLYERFGFTTVGHVRGGASMPDVWVMRREPRSSSADSNVGAGTER